MATESSVREDRQVWSDVNTGEVLPDVVTPMTWSVLKPVVHALVGGFLERMGMDLSRQVLFDRVAGRVYTNVNTVLAFIRRVPGMKDRGLTEIFGGQQDGALADLEIAEADIPDVGFSVWRMLRGMPGLAWELLTYTPAKGQLIVERARRASEALRALDTDRFSDTELIARTVEAIEGLVADVEVMSMTGVVQTYEQVLYARFKDWFGDEGNALAARLLAGLGNNDNAEAGLALWALASQARDHDQVRDAVMAAGDASDLGAMTDSEEGRVFLEAWDAFMVDHGHHTRGEIELANPRWSEDPDVILDQVRNCLEAYGIHDFSAHYAELATGRAEAEAEARRRLRNPLKRLVFAFLLRKARRCAPLRECLKSEIVRQLAGIRRLLRALGGRLTARGVLDAPDDIFFLAYDEIDGIADGSVDAKEKIANRRGRYERDLAITPAAVVIGRFDPARHGRPPADRGTTDLRGVAVSPGVVVGPARVILRAGAGRVRPGEILVAPFTDPGWTPYFLNAAAIVMDLGGVLSHGSIVAREFGIPAVVNVGPATELVRTGQTLRVDGARGVVTILD